MTCLPSSLRALGVLSAALATLALTACGGNDDSPAVTAPAPSPVAGTPPPASPPPPPPPMAPAPPPAVSTTVTGAVVKGPVSGAQVCAYTVVANGRGSALGSALRFRCRARDG